MRMSRREGLGLPIAGAILFNALLFLAIPFLSQPQKVRETFRTGRPISITEPPQLESTASERRRMPRDETPPAELPRVSIPKPRSLSSPPALKPEIPMPQLEVPPELDKGVDVALPPPKLVSKPPSERLNEPQALRESDVSSEGATQPAPLSVPSEYEMGEVDQVPQVLSRVEPVYPYLARRRNVSGRVVVRFLVGRNGQVTNLTIVEARPDGVFEKTVLEAVQKWRFKPGYVGGRAVSTWVVLPIQFKLSS